MNTKFTGVRRRLLFMTTSLALVGCATSVAPAALQPSPGDGAPAAKKPSAGLAAAFAAPLALSICEEASLFRTLVEDSSDVDGCRCRCNGSSCNCTTAALQKLYRAAPAEAEMLLAFKKSTRATPSDDTDARVRQAMGLLMDIDERHPRDVSLNLLIARKAGWLAEDPQGVTLFKRADPRGRIAWLLKKAPKDARVLMLASDAEKDPRVAVHHLITCLRHAPDNEGCRGQYDERAAFFRRPACTDLSSIELDALGSDATDHVRFSTADFLNTTVDHRPPAEHKLLSVEFTPEAVPRLVAFVEAHAQHDVALKANGIPIVTRRFMAGPIQGLAFEIKRSVDLCQELADRELPDDLRWTPPY